MPERLRVPPTRSVLLRLRKRQQSLLSAVELLERKRRVLAQKTFELLPRWEELHGQAYAQLAEAYRSFTLTNLRSTAIERRQIVGGMQPMLSANIQRRPIAGVQTVEVTPEVVPLRPRFGLLGSTAELDRTIEKLRDATAELSRLAGLSATLRSLARALSKTNRQVHMLRDRLIPLYSAAIRNIEEILDEQERAYLFQLKRIR
jgi:V/A-type H+-transporting ATPase subunit D